MKIHRQILKIRPGWEAEVAIYEPFNPQSAKKSMLSLTLFRRINRLDLPISQRQGELGFVFLAIDTASPYVDNRPLKVAGQTEWRDYRACWWDKTTATLNFGPTLRVLVGV